MRRFALPLIALMGLAACGDDGGTGGAGGSTSSSGGGGEGTGATGAGGEGTGATGGGGAGQGGSAQGGGGAGQGGSAQGGSGQGGSAQGGAGQGGSAQGGSGQGGSMMGVESNCADTMDDDGDMQVDCADTDCAQAAVCGQLVINEIDYDQYQQDTAEFVEVYNAGTTTVDLGTVQLLLVNGSTMAPAVYDTFDLGMAGTTLPPGGYAVVASANVTPAMGAVVVPLGGGSFQNAISGMAGSGDGVVLYDTAHDALLDRFCYEAAVSGATVGNLTMVDLVEGTVATAIDYDAGMGIEVSLSRIPNGADTDVADADWRATSTLTPGAANVLAEACNNGLDDDGDMLVDCADASCSMSPACSEICDDNVDNNANMLVDCQEMLCDMQACDPNGKVCTGGMCMCLGPANEAVCNDATDDDCDGLTDCSDPDCAMAPMCQMLGVTSVDYPVIALGGKLVITGAGFTGATMVTIGGVSQTFVVDSGNQITIAAVADGTPIGASQPLVVTVGGSSSPAFNVAPIRLQISELDCDTTGSPDTAEFVEVSTGVPGVSLAGYTLVLWNGSGDTSYRALALAASTDANGRLLVGNPGLMPAPAITFPNDGLQNGQDAASIHQASAATFPNGTAVASQVGLIDALVYDTNDADDTDLLMSLGMQSTQVNEGAVASQTESIQRCGDGRNNGMKYATGAPTPGAANGVAACP